MTEVVNVLCMKWGTKYPADYVNRLYSMVARNIRRPFRFVCLTDDNSDLGENIESFPLPELSVNLGGPERGWNKLSVFSQELYDLKGKVLCLDLDLIITSKPSEKSFFNNKEDLVGRKLKKNLKVDQLLHPRHLYERFEVNIGDFLSIVSQMGNASVAVAGEAEDSGNLGDIIKVKNLRSGKVVKGYVNKNKIIRVFR